MCINYCDIVITKREMETYSIIQEVSAQIFTTILNDRLKSIKNLHSFIQWMYTNNEDEQNMIEGATLGVFILWTSW